MKAVFSREGAERLREEVQSMGPDSLRAVSASAGLPSRAGGAWISVSELRAALVLHLTSASGADGRAQAGNLHDLDCDPLSKERIL